MAVMDKIDHFVYHIWNPVQVPVRKCWVAGPLMVGGRAGAELVSG
jgi:hypothetical protein